MDFLFLSLLYVINISIPYGILRKKQWLNQAYHSEPGGRLRIYQQGCSQLLVCTVCFCIRILVTHICGCVWVHVGAWGCVWVCWTKPLPTRQAAGMAVLSFWFVLCLSVYVSGFYQSINPLMKRPIIDGFKSLSYLWKRLDKTLQSC